MIHKIDLTIEQRRQIRLACGESGTTWPILVVSGDSPPKRCGSEGYHTFRGSDIKVNWPGSALRAGKKVDYHASTLRIEVGLAWLSAQEWFIRKVRPEQVNSITEAIFEEKGKL